MKHKVLGSVFVLAVALGMISVTLRTPQATPMRAPVAITVGSAPATAETAVAPVEPLAKKLQGPAKDRALASYRVYEYGIERGMDFRGAGYTAQVSETGVRFGNPGGSLLLGTPRFEQGSKTIETAAPSFVHPAFGVARLERGAITEEYVFENSRMEQLFRIPAPLGEGDFKVRVPLSTTFPSVVETHGAFTGKFEPAEFLHGGIAVMDVTGAVRFGCTSAVAVDAAGNRLTLGLSHENGQIAMVVPASFMEKAVYPVVIDPWFGSRFSNNPGGVSNTASASERPAYKDGVIAWADASTGNFEIYVKIAGVGGFSELQGSASGGGISNNKGDSVNPTIVVDSAGLPTVAWEDVSGGARSIYLKQFIRTGTSAAWTELAGSASALGVNSTFFSSSHPSVGILAGRVPGTVSVDGNGVVTSTPARSVNCPVVAWDSGNIYVSAYYPGAPAIPPFGGNQAFPAVPEGWYLLGAPNGLDVNISSQVFNGAYSPGPGEFPNLIVGAGNQVTVTWQAIVGNTYQILASRWTLPAPPPVSTVFQVVANQIPNPRLDMLPASNFQGIAAPAAPFDNVSGTTGLSQYPTICADGGGGICIAWQETEPSAIPANAGSSQIYLKRSTGGAWTPVAGSTNPGGISRTGLAYDGSLLVPPVPGNASFPSVDGAGNLIGVAWEDTSNSRSSIYLRVAAIGGTTWDQVGFQGSAFPPRLPIVFPPPLPEPAPIGGVSQSPNFALHPQLDMGDGPTVVWADGSGSTFDILLATFFPNGPGQAVGVGTINPTFQLTIRQTSDDPSLPGGGIDVPVGDFTVGTSVWLSSHVFTETLTPPGTSLRLEFEIQPTGVPFTFTPTHQALFVAPDVPPVALPAPAPTSLALLKFDGLPNTNYHYMTRSIDQIGRSSPWFEQTNIGGVSFRVNSAASGGPANTGTVVAGNTKNKGSCGLLGLEAVAALGLIRLLRRKRSK